MCIPLYLAPLLLKFHRRHHNARQHIHFQWYRHTYVVPDKKASYELLRILEKHYYRAPSNKVTYKD